MDKRKRKEHEEEIEDNEKEEEEVKKEEEEVEEGEEEEGEEEEEEGEEEKKENSNDDEGYDDGYEEEDYDDDYDNDERLQELLFKQLVDLRNKKRKHEGSKKTNFVSFLKNFLKLNMEQRAKQLTDKHVFDFMKLSKAIINKKIKMNISENDLDVLKELVEPETRADERKLVLIEDFRLKVIFKKALNILEEHLNDGSQNTKKARHDRGRKFTQTTVGNDKKSRRQRNSSKRY